MTSKKKNFFGEELTGRRSTIHNRAPGYEAWNWRFRICQVDRRIDKSVFREPFQFSLLVSIVLRDKGRMVISLLKHIRKSIWKHVQKVFGSEYVGTLKIQRFCGGSLLWLRRFYNSLWDLVVKTGVWLQWGRARKSTKKERGMERARDLVLIQWEGKAKPDRKPPRCSRYR